MNISPVNTLYSSPYVPENVLTVADYHAIWDEWAKAARPGSREERDVAVREMKRCLETGSTKACFCGRWLEEIPDPLPPGITELDATCCDLVKLPENLPHTLKKLSVMNSNRLTSLPDNLPPYLEEIKASNTGLVALGQNFALLEKLTRLDLSHCKLEGTLADLPPSLEKLYLSCNLQLTNLPEHLPQNLKKLDVSYCRLRALPESIIDLHQTVIDIEDNPFPLRVLQNLQLLTSAPGYTGPRFRFNMPQEKEGYRFHSLSQSVANWYPYGERASALQRWSEIEPELNSDVFGNFLERLGHTVSGEIECGFSSKVVLWLEQLLNNPPLREVTFAIALDALSSCEDRVALSYLHMRRTEVINELDSGKYDNMLARFVEIARQIFRHEKLDEIAAEKVKTLNFVDEIEVYLAYPVYLTLSLQLGLTPNHMRFYGVSNVTKEDLNDALLRVRQLENQTFSAWLSQWAPWKNVISRIERDSYEEAQEKLYTALESFDAQLTIRLAEKNLQDDAEAKVFEGKRLNDEIIRNNDWELTSKVLSKRDLMHILNNKWY